MPVAPVLSGRDIERVVKGLEDQGAAVRRVSTGRYRVEFQGEAQSLALGSSDRQQILGARSKMIRMGLQWPLDPAVKPKKEPSVGDPAFETLAAEARERALAAEARIQAERATVTKEIPVVDPNKPRTKSDEVLQEWIEVGPELAEKLLAHNTANRPLRPLQVAQLARDMEAGNWRVTGDSIKFDVNDRLIDGQHRLHAVVKSGTTVKVLMIIGLQPEAREVIDTNARRSAADALHLNGVGHYATIIAGATRIALGREAGYYNHALENSKPSFTNSEVLEWFEEHPSITYAAEVASRAAKAIDLTPSPLAYCIYILMEVDSEAAHEFIQSMSEYRLGGTGDPRVALLNYFRNARSDQRRRLGTTEILYVMFRAWNAWRMGETLVKFSGLARGGPSGSAIPVPV